MCLLFQCRRHCTEIYWYTMSSGAVFLYIVYTHTFYSRYSNQVLICCMHVDHLIYKSKKKGPTSPGRWSHITSFSSRPVARFICRALGTVFLWNPLWTNSLLLSQTKKVQPFHGRSYPRKPRTPFSYIWSQAKDKCFISLLDGTLFDTRRKVFKLWNKAPTLSSDS